MTDSVQNVIPEIAVVCCIEAGKLERQTVAMLSTLRRFGGALAHAPAIAIIGRKGPALHPESRVALAALDVEIVDAWALNPAPWFNYANKIAAVLCAQARFSTSHCLWLDSDIFVCAEPRFVGASLDRDFSARFEFTGPIVDRSGAGDRFRPYWDAVSDLYGLDFEAFPYCDLDMPEKSMKPYFNSGVFLWRRSTGFAERYGAYFDVLIRSRLAPTGVGPWFADQVSLTAAVISEALNWTMLDAADNLMLFKNFHQMETFQAALPAASVIHYSKSRTSPNAPEFHALLRRCHPDLAQVVADLDRRTGAIPDPTGFQLLQAYRSLRQKAFVRFTRNV